MYLVLFVQLYYDGHLIWDLSIPMQFLFTYCMNVLKSENVFTCTREHLKKKKCWPWVTYTLHTWCVENLYFFFLPCLPILDGYLLKNNRFYVILVGELMDNLNVFQMNLFAPCAPYIYVYPQRHKCLCLLSVNIFVRNSIELLGRTNF